MEEQRSTCVLWEWGVCEDDDGVGVMVEGGLWGMINEGI